MTRRGAARPRFTLTDTEPLAARACDAPGCGAAGEYRAPRDRTRLRDYYWFCLQHVREYNAAWDYFRGMSPEEIERHLRDDAGWQRPTWPLGRLGRSALDPAEYLRDPLGVLEGGPKPPPRSRRTDEAPPELRAALGVLGLGWPVGQEELRARYKELAKRYHPDSNGGDRSAEDRLKDINRAYSLLRAKLAPRRPAPPAARAAAHGATPPAPQGATAG
ncbi:J domain-containing protein [Caldovatus aquaticus]|uniref:J domain-containing protein n=1 Tax=Caldovatus aquaticus TaxID=2865671 RepID=A0ABS7EZ43_9PROT|nr:J domain-containing protein [Caldovatus aquaticus]MBW8268348.1 J domain-containing protein [Caldovatus aquaticus]